MMTNHSRLVKKRTTDGKIKKRISLKQANALDFHPLEPRQMLAAVTVTTANDLTNADTSSIAALIANDGGDGISLREAITASNNTAGEDTISFDSNVFTGGANSLIRLTQGELEINEELTIDGATATDIVITGDAAANDFSADGTFITAVDSSLEADKDSLDDNSRVINFSSPVGTLSLSNVTITGGRIDGRGGGGIYANSGNVSLFNSTLSGNSVGDRSQGGAIHVRSGNLTVIGSVLSDNRTGYRGTGGGIYANSGNVSLLNSTLSGNSVGDRGRGGAVNARLGDFTVINSVISENSAGDFGNGGGIRTTSGTVTIDDSVVSNNSTGESGYGGAIYTSSSNIILTGSLISENSAGRDESSRTSFGGGIFLRSGDLVLEESTVSGNSVSGESATGGGIWTGEGEVFLFNSTLSGNNAQGAMATGGGISSLDAHVQIFSSTITENTAASVGGGIFFEDEVLNENERLTIINSIVAGNTDNGTAPDLVAPRAVADVLVIEHSLIGTTAGSDITSRTGTGNILNQPALLGPLADNGGPTMNHALLAGSPAINAGSNSMAVDDNGVQLATDQRGEPRIKVGVVDLGAFESDFDSLSPPTVVSAVVDEGGVLARPDLWNTLTVVFDSNVTVPANALSLLNISPFGTTVDLSGIGFSFDTSTNTATWDFTVIDPLDAGFYTYRIDPNAITSGNVTLDGDGDGIRGDAFEGQRYVALPGDANLDGTVDVLSDALSLVSNLGATTNAVWGNGDFNADGAINVLGDGIILVTNINRNVQLLSDITVDNTTDLVNGDTSSVFALIADDGGDGVSLREAVTASNNTIGLGTITFDGDVFTGGLNSLIRLTQGELLITEELTIDASPGTEVVITGDANGDDITLPGSFITDVDASYGGTVGASNDLLEDNSRVINLSSVTFGSLTLLDLTLTGGRTTSDDERGGGILTSFGNISLINSAISGNSTSGERSDGGAISTNSGDISLTNSFIYGNTVSGYRADGGGIYANSGDVTLTSSTFSENRANQLGGGISTILGNVTVTGSTVEGNETSVAFGSGGGIHSSSGDVSLITTIVRENSAGSGGGVGTTSGSVSLTDSSIYGNSANGGFFADGGGVSTLSGNISLTNSTVSGNTVNGDNAEGGQISTSSGDILLNASIASRTIVSGDGAKNGETATSSRDVLLTNSTASGNGRHGIWSDNSNLSLVNGPVTKNTSGGTVFEVDSDNQDQSLTIVNSIDASNTFSGTAPELFAPADVENNLIVERSLIGGSAGSGIELALAGDHDLRDNVFGSDF